LRYQTKYNFFYLIQGPESSYQTDISYIVKLLVDERGESGPCILGERKGKLNEVKIFT